MRNDIYNACVNCMGRGKDDSIVVSVDGQYGSTGKGVIVAALSECFASEFSYNITNAGPNSGHTFYTRGDRKIVLKQLPTFAVAAALNGQMVPEVFLSAGAVIDSEILMEERRILGEHVPFDYHPNAAVINKEDVEKDQANVRNMASTGKGIGPAIIRKMERRGMGTTLPGSHYTRDIGGRIFMEISQGFSLGINSGFYPHVTTRECTVAQGIADAGLPAQWLSSVIMSVRTFPIRVGSTENSSGPCYGDQREISFEDIDVEPEFTTVTKRQRRIFTWSREQYRDACFANRPNILFVNFMNYLSNHSERKALIHDIINDSHLVMGRSPVILLGYGPKTSNIKVYKEGMEL